MKCKASEELFNRYKKLKFDLDFLSGIVQNDMELDDVEFAEWCKSFITFEDKLSYIRVLTIEHIEKTNEM